MATGKTLPAFSNRTTVRAPVPNSNAPARAVQCSAPRAAPVKTAQLHVSMVTKSSHQSLDLQILFSVHVLAKERLGQCTHNNQITIAMTVMSEKNTNLEKQDFNDVFFYLYLLRLTPG